MKQKTNIAAKILGGLSFLIYFFLWAPVIVIIVFSFSGNKYGTSWDGFTLKWYAELFNNVDVKDALIRSLTVASITVIVSTLIGTITGYGLYKLHFRGNDALFCIMHLGNILPCFGTARFTDMFETQVREGFVLLSCLAEL